MPIIGHPKFSPPFYDVAEANVLQQSANIARRQPSAAGYRRQNTGYFAMGPVKTDNVPKPIAELHQAADRSVFRHPDMGVKLRYSTLMARWFKARSQFGAQRHGCAS